MGEVLHFRQRPSVHNESNFLDLYLHAVGRTEVPEQFHLWTALSLIAACLEHRVWFERMAYQRLYPNLYVFLIGDSASGKGTAIGLGKRVLDDMDRRGYGVNYYRGAITRAAMQDILATRWKVAWKEYEKRIQSDDIETIATAHEPSGVSLFTLAPELSSNLSVGPMAKDMIKFLTDLWEGDTGKYTEQTRGTGVHEFENPCLNCLFASTPDWCREVIDAKDLTSGFWARSICVLGSRSLERVARPETAQWIDTLEVLSWRLSLLMKKVARDDLEFSGPMRLSPEADRLDIEWYETRAMPEDPLFAAHWNRQPDQIIRIAMLLKFCDYWDLGESQSESWRVIGARHWQRARMLSDGLMQNAVTFLGRSLGYTYNAQSMIVEDIVRQSGMIMQRPDLLRRAGNYGVKAKGLEKIIQGLEDEQKVRRIPVGTQGGYRVEWIG